MAYANGEAVVFDPNPVINILLRDQQQKQAQNLALEQQIRADMNKLKPDGIRSVDTPEYTKAYQNMQNAGIKYRLTAANTKDPLKRAQAYNEFQNYISDVTGLINESKEAKEREKLGYGFYSKNADKLDLDSYNNYMTGVKSPVRSGAYVNTQGKDISSVLFNPENFNAQKLATLYGSVKPTEKIVDQKELPTGQFKVSKVKYTDPKALAQIASTAFDGDYAHMKKFYTTQYEHALPGEIENLQSYTQKYLDPNFQITSPKEYAIASALYGKVEQDMGAETKGSAWRSQIAAANARQANSQQFQREMYTQRKNDKGNKDIRFAVDDMAEGLRLGETARVIGPLEGAAKSDTRVRWIARGVMNDKLMDELYRAMRINGSDNVTKNITREEFENGIAVVAVPKLDKNKKPIKGQFTYMAIPQDYANPQERLNKMINFASGGNGKPLPQNWYNQHLGQSTEIADEEVSEGEFDDTSEDEEITEEQPNEE